jgi:hypothetical protein
VNIKKNKLTFAMIVFIYLLIEGTCYFNLWVLRTHFKISYNPNISRLSDEQKARLRNFLQKRRGQYAQQDPVLGWVYYDSTNTSEMRDNLKYEKVPLPGKLRLSTFGDSFTFASDVKLEESWGKVLARQIPSCEVLNYGVGAYGLDQAYLRYQQIGTEYHPHMVLIGYMSENLARHVNVYRGFYTGAYRNTIFTKPRFQLQNGQLVLLKNPLSTVKDYEYFLNHDEKVLARLGKNDYHYQRNYNGCAFDFLPSVRFVKLCIATLRNKFGVPIFTSQGLYNMNSEAYQITEKIFDAFYQNVLQNEALPIIVIFPDMGDQMRSRRKKERRYTPLLEHFNSKGYRYIDLLEALKPYEAQYNIDELVEKRWGHFSPLGNKIIAEYIANQLDHWDLADVKNVREAVGKERERRALGNQDK